MGFYVSVSPLFIDNFIFKEVCQMSFDFSKFRKQVSGTREVNPIKIYDSLSKSKVNDLWRGQYLALESLNSYRTEPNIVLNLNTGGGKTLIGLLEGQSIVNETRGRVFYLCGSNQLVKQTSESAESLGLKVATYFSRQFENEMEFNLGQVQCITNYQALFNGKSRLARDEVQGLIFDDSHVASHIVRENFTLQLTEREFPDTYATLIGQVRPYFESIFRIQEFDQVVTFKTDPEVLFIPMFVWDSVSKRVIEAMTHEGVSEKNTKFAWEHLKNSLDLCAVFITSYSIEISSFLPPVHELIFMSSNTRKIFLSATVQDEPEFVRTFGFLPESKVEPKTSAGESERLIVTPYVNKVIKENIFEFIINLSSEHKILVIPKSEQRAKPWREYEMSFNGEDFSERVKEFKESSAGILVAPARFEGMDFPGDTCRLLVVDGLPSGTGLMEKFLWSSLGENKFLQGTIASRVVQSMGRISRGNDDYGAVFLLGDDIGDWITRTNNRKKLPLYTLAQLELGENLCKGLETVDDLSGLILSVLGRSDGWNEIHNEHVQPFSVTSTEEGEVFEKNLSPQTDIAFTERKFLKLLWDRDYGRAVRQLEPTLNKLFEIDRALAAWHAHWIGFSYLKGGNPEAAERYFNRAANAFKKLGRMSQPKELVKALPLIDENVTQAQRIAKVLSERGDFNYGSFSEMDGRLAALTSEKSSTNEYEQALFWLGQYCGFVSSRPDHDSEIGRGPDVFWASPEVDISIESKEAKGENSSYSKRDVGQSHNHAIWYKEEFPDSKRLHKLMIVGPYVTADSAASPGDVMSIWLREEIVELATRIRQLLKDSYMDTDAATFTGMLEERLRTAYLTNVDIFNSLPERPIPREDKN